MIYRVQLTYMDGQSLNLDVSEDQYKLFFQSLNERKVYWNEEASRGFWTNFEQVRYMNIFPIPAEKKEEVEVVEE